MPAEPRPAATVLVLRESDDDAFEVFMVQRHRKSGFMPSAWVFPGGRVDPTDHLHDHPRVRGGEAPLRQMGVDRRIGLPFLVAAVRETFEESGVWLGTGALPASVRDPLARGEHALADLLDAHDATVDLDRLGAWSWWVTPDAEPRRYDTRFLVARATAARARHDERETVDSAWFRPADALERAQRGELPLAPPTWWTLTELAELDSLEALWAGLEARPRRPIQPILEIGDGSLELRLPGHPEHPEPAIDGLPARIGFAQGRWWATD